MATSSDIISIDTCRRTLCISSLE